MNYGANLATGFFGVPGSARGNFTVHAVRGRDPICGWRPRQEMEFQWCAWGIHFDYLECEGCRSKAREIAQLMTRKK